MYINSPFEDLGLVVDTTNMAAGATVYGNWITNAEWVRHINFMATSDQQYDVVVMYEDKNGIQSNQKTIVASQSANAAYWRPDMKATFPMGSKIKFGIKNSSASTNTFAKLRVQMYGL